MAFDRDSIVRLHREGIDAKILKGVNTINNIVIMSCAQGVGQYFVDLSRGSSRTPNAVVGYDSRIQGAAFAKAVTEVLLQTGLDVFLFDEPVPYPEVTFAIPHLNSDVGIFISASHNDYRYNGFKLSGPNGAQIPRQVRNEILEEYIEPVVPRDIKWRALEDLSDEELVRLTFLGGRKPLDGVDYYGREGSVLDIHSEHINHIKTFILRPDVFSTGTSGEGSLKIAFSAFNGSGRRAVPRLLKELGVGVVHSISALDPLNGLFPSFESAPGKEQQPDPGDVRAAVVALTELQEDGQDWSTFDLLIGTDPDADRCGIVVHPPGPLEEACRSTSVPRFPGGHVLVPADDIWTLLMWYRLEHQSTNEGAIPEAEKKFVALSHTTSDALEALATKYGVGVVKTWVGFGQLSAAVTEAWVGRGLPRIRGGRLHPTDTMCDKVFYDTRLMSPGMVENLAAMEQSNGFSILGSPPSAFSKADDRTLGVGGHVRDKDGTFAALLVAELAAWAKKNGTDLLSLLAEEIYSDPEVGLFVNYYEPDPMDGEYPGLAGDSKKKGIIDAVEDLANSAAAGKVTLGSELVSRTEFYRTGKYDEQNWTGFPDEGVRFFFSSDRDHLTMRPSGTGNSLRFHVQLFGGSVAPEGAWQLRVELEERAKGMVSDLRQRVGAD